MIWKHGELSICWVCGHRRGSLYIHIISNHASASTLRYNSTNDLDYPSSWNALSRADKKGIFYKSAYDCCLNHFNDDVNCQIVDICDDDDDSTYSTTPSAFNLDSELSLQHDGIPAPSVASAITPSIPRCSQWRPSKAEPGSCTNELLPDGERWPLSMFRTSHTDCCRDFFKLSSCSIVDVCREL